MPTQSRRLYPGQIFWKHFGPMFLGLLVAFALSWLAVSFAKLRIDISADSVKENVAQFVTDSGYEVEDFPLARMDTLALGSVELKTGVIVMRSRVDATLFGKHVEADLVASGRPLYERANLISLLYEAAVEPINTPRSIYYNFTRFEIVPDTFLIDGEPAIETAIPAGQSAVRAFTERGIGKAVKNIAGGLGVDVSDEALDGYTAKGMRTYDDLLIALFSNYVKSKINNQALYTFGESPAEQTASQFLWGFEIQNGTFTVVLSAAWILIGVTVGVWTLFFGGGYVYWARIGVRVFNDVSPGTIDPKNMELIERAGDMAEVAEDMSSR